MILLDEPTGNLDSTSAAEVLAILERVHQGGATIVMVTHDSHAASFADRLLFLADGVVEKELGRSESSAILSTLAEVSGR